MTISRTLYIFKFLVKCSDGNHFCIKCKYHISKILLRIATKRARITPKILLTTKSTVFTLKILLLASKPSGYLVPRCRNNFQLWHRAPCMFLCFFDDFARCHTTSTYNDSTYFVVPIHFYRYQYRYHIDTSMDTDTPSRIYTDTDSDSDTGLEIYIDTDTNTYRAKDL